jgi:hypothetical protein
MFRAGTSDKSEASAVLNTYLNLAEQYLIGQQFDEALRLCPPREGDCLLS